MKDKSARLNRREIFWILYDVGNSAFVLLATAVLPLYFNSLAQGQGIGSVDYLAYWGYAMSISTLIVAFVGPVFGAASDSKGRKKVIFLTSVLIGVAAFAALGVPMSWWMFLVLFILAKVAFSASLVFYDSMLTDITLPERMDMVSSHGYAWGYIGSVVPFIISLVLILFGDKFGIGKAAAFPIVFILNALWWLVFTLPLLKVYQQTYYIDEAKATVRQVFVRLGHSLKEIARQKKILFFLLAFFFYIDGVYTIIDMATAYGASLGLDDTGLLLALLLTQIVAFPCAIFFSYLSKIRPAEQLIKICIIAYGCIAAFAIQLDKQWEFWLLAVCVGIFQGAIQALSRSYFARIIPPKRSGEYFGLFDICGKGAAFIGTFMISVITKATGKPAIGVSTILPMFILGFYFFKKAADLPLKKWEEESFD